MASKWKSNRAIAIFLLLVYCWRKFTYADEEANVQSKKVGEYVVFDCDIDFPQNIIIPHVLQWRKDKELIFSWSDGAMTYNENFINRINLLSETDAWQHGRASINITNIRETDEGWYECKVTFPSEIPSTKSNGTWFYLKVKEGNMLAVPPVNETVMEGESVEMKCVSKMHSSYLTWYKDAISVQSITELKERIEISSEGSLNIRNTEMKDSGYYSCEITNEEGVKQAAGAYLNVRFKAKVIYAPRRVYLSFGKPGRLECYYRANPEITKIRWEKDGFLFDAYNVPGVFSRKNGSLYFNKVDDSHAGEYTCTPYNNLGTNGPSPRMQVIVQRAPVFTLTPHVLYLRKIGETVVMQCDAVDGEGIEKPSISWHKKNGEIAQNKSIITGGNLTIVDIQMSDRGPYQCVATNEAATITSEAELLVEETLPSRAPYNVTADVTSNSATVRWLNGYAKPKLKYSVWYRNNKAQDWKMIELSSNLYEAKIPDLSPGNTYDVMVLSQNEDGDGIFSKTVRITTKIKESEEETFETEVDREFRSPVGLYQQIGPPSDVYIRVTEEGFNVNWKPPKHGQEMLKYYTVVWYREMNERVGAIETLSNSVLIRNLEEQKIYKIQIFAMSTNDYETPSQKYIYCVPSFSAKKYLLIGTAIGASTVLIIIAIIWYICDLNNKTSVT